MKRFFFFSHQLSQRLLQSSFSLSCWVLGSNSLPFSFLFFFYFSYNPKVGHFIPGHSQNQVVESESWSPSLTHLMFKNTTKERKGRKMQSLILDLPPALAEVGKDNSVLFCCRELWFLCGDLWPQCDRVGPPHKSCPVPSATPWEGCFVVDVENLEDFRH